MVNVLCLDAVAENITDLAVNAGAATRTSYMNITGGSTNCQFRIKHREGRLVLPSQYKQLNINKHTNMKNIKSIFTDRKSVV